MIRFEFSLGICINVAVLNCCLNDGLNWENEAHVCLKNVCSDISKITCPCSEMFLSLTCTIQSILRLSLYMSLNLKESYWKVVVQQLSICVFTFFFSHVRLNHLCLRIMCCLIIRHIIKKCKGTQFTVQSYQASLSKESLQKSIQNNVLFFAGFFSTNTHWAYCHIFSSSFASLKM